MIIIILRKLVLHFEMKTFTIQTTVLTLYQKQSPDTNIDDYVQTLSGVKQTF